MTDGLDALPDRVDRLLADRDRVVIGIAGAPGAGKSTLADVLLAAAGDRGVAAAVLPMDGYHLSDAALARLGRLDRKGAIDTFDAGGYVSALERVRRRDDLVWVPSFDRELEQPIAGSIPIAAEVRLVVTEGNYLLVSDDPWRRVKDLLDEAWFVEIDETERRRRLVDRHVRFGKEPATAAAWVETVDEPNARRIAATRSRADRIVKGT